MSSESKVSNTGRMAGQLPSADIGAWILRCNPIRWPEVHDHIATGDPIGDWRIADNYRQHLMQPGQRIYFYIGGNHTQTPPGIYGIGEVTDVPRDGCNGDGWADPADRGRAGIFVPIDLRDLKLRCTRAQLQVALPGCELMRAPQLGNPIVLTPEEDGVIQRLLDM